MGRRGPKPKPTAAKKLAGNPGKRRLPTREPVPPAAGAIVAPTWLDDEARAEWDRVAPGLVAAQIVTAVDVTLLAVYCASFSAWLAAKAELKKHGSVVVVLNEDGSIKYQAPSPHVNIAAKALAAMKTLAAELGLTPSARTRLSVGQADNETLDAQAMRILGGD